ncbi:MAG TPA: S9 family peptidase [Candidatus Nanopelagicales bacterium]|nr:S9 family peptidase [Candidatus Nanopelagicales bacterium]
MSRSARSDEVDEALLPNAGTALEAAATELAEPPAPSGPTVPRRRGRPPGSKNKPKAAATAAVARRTTPTSVPPTTPAAARGARLTIEQIVAVESPREPRLSPDGRRVAYTAEGAGARQVFVLDLRSGVVRQVTASEHTVSDPQWSPDGTRLAYVREKAIWIVGIDGTRATIVADHPAGQLGPRWAPDGRRIAFVSRRRGWSQAWVVAAPLPRRGPRPARTARPEPVALTAAGMDVESLRWSPDGSRIAALAQRDPDLTTMQVTVVDAGSGEERVVAGVGAWETSPRWLPDGSGLLIASDRDGWFQVVRVPLDGGDRQALTSGPVEHGDYNAGFGLAPLPSPDGTRFVHPVLRDGFVDLVVAPLSAAAPARRRPGRPPKRRPAEAAAGAGVRINPVDGVWRAVDWLPDGSGILAIGASERDPEDFWVLPVPAADDARPRPRRLTRSLPAVLPVGGFVEPERLVIQARDGLAIPATLWRPVAATGKRGGKIVPTIVNAHGGPSWQVLRDFQPFRQLLVQEGYAFLSVDFRGSTGHGRDFRLANRGEWGHADLHDVIDAARWVGAQPWSNGKLAMFGGSYGGYLTLCALVEEPGMWVAGVDLFGDSEIAESFRHGDRAGRIDLQRMMGSPDDPARAELFRRGSPLYRVERIEAPLLILHGRKDRRVVPLMTEKMVEALEIEGKHHEVHWYDEEGHGWERRENRRDAFSRIVGWLKRYALEEPPAAER